MEHFDIRGRCGICASSVYKEEWAVPCTGIEEF